MQLIAHASHTFKLGCVVPECAVLCRIAAGVWMADLNQTANFQIARIKQNESFTGSVICN